MTDKPPDYGAAATESSYGQTAGDAPPTYDSIYGELRNARQTAGSHTEFVSVALKILQRTVGCLIISICFMSLPIAILVIGIVYKDDCPAEKMIPMFLIVWGAFGIIKNLSSCGQSLKQRSSTDGQAEGGGENGAAAKRANCIDGLLGCFLFAWFIAGNVWVFRTDPQYSDKSQSDYCDQTCYLFAKWAILTVYILMGLACCCGCLAACAAICMKSGGGDEQPSGGGGGATTAEENPSPA